MPRAGRLNALPAESIGFVLNQRSRLPPPSVGLRRGRGRAVGPRVPVRAGARVGHVEGQATLDDHRGVGLPASEDRLRRARGVGEEPPSAAEGQLGQGGQREVVLAVPVRAAPLEVADVEELVAAVLPHLLPGVVGLERIAAREPPREPGLQRVVAVVGAVAEVVDVLRPAVGPAQRAVVHHADGAGEVGPSVVARDPGHEALQRRLVHVEGRPVAGEHVCALVPDVPDLEEMWLVSCRCTVRL